MPILGDPNFSFQPITLPAGVTMPGRFDPTTAIYLPTGFARLQYAHAALARARNGGAPFHIAFVGDSITRGAIGGASNPPNLSYPGQLRALIGRFGTVSEGWITGADNAQDTRITLGTGWAADGSFGVYGWTGTNPAGALVIAPTTTGTVVKVQYAKRSADSATIAVRIDGGAPTNANTNSVASVDMGMMTITGLSNTTHSINIQVTGGQAWITGVVVQQPTGGCMISRWGRDGQNTPGPNGSTNKWEFIGAPLETGPDLMFVNFTSNDYYFNNNTPASAYAGLAQMAPSAAAKSCDLIYTVPGLTNPPGVGGAGVLQSSWTKVIYDAAQTNGCPLVDFGHKWGLYSLANARGLMADANHPTATGYGGMAEIVDRALAVLV